MNIPEIYPDRLLNDFHDFDLTTDPPIIKITGQKVLVQSENQNSPLLPGLITEYNLQCKLSHPAIQTAVGFCHPNEEYYLITPFPDNGNLENILHSFSANTSEKKTLKFIILIGIVMGMDHLHNNNIIHGNLKPSCVLVNQNQPILCGFGTPINTLNLPHDINTFRYCPPEVLCSNGIYDKKSDVYSFGLIANAIYSGEIPFLNSNYDEMMNTKINSSITAHQSIPRAIRNIISQCLSLDKEMRPTFSDIYNVLERNYRDISPNISLVSNYIDSIYTARKKKTTFKIPQQIIDLQNIKEFDRNNPNPINFAAINEVFHPENNKKAIIIILIGCTQIGKSTFLQNLTGNLAYLSGQAIKTVTRGIHVDGPYYKEQLILNIFEEDFQEKIELNNISDDTEIYFMDSQGMGDPEYKKYANCLNRIYPIFCFASTICISIIESKDFDKTIPVINTIRKMQLINFQFTPIYMLVRGYVPFNNLDDISFDSIDEFNESFSNLFAQENSQIVNAYPKNSFIPIAMGDCILNLSNYIHSIWYSFYSIFSQINENKLIQKDVFVQNIEKYSNFLFTPEFIDMEDCITGFKQKVTVFDKKSKTSEVVLKDFRGKQKERLDEVSSYFSKQKNDITNILRLSISSTFYISDCVCFCLEKSLDPNTPNIELISNLESLIKQITQFILPFYFGDYNIKSSDFAQYSIEIKKDVNSYMRANYKDWEIHMKQEKYSKLSQYPFLMAGSIGVSIPVINLFVIPIGIGVISFWKMYSAIQKGIRNKIKVDSFKLSIFPFIWSSNLKKNNGKKIDIGKSNRIGSNKEQLIVFYEQPYNDSTLIFQALTGFNVDFANEKQVSSVFYDVPIKSMLERYRRNNKKKVIESNLLNDYIKKVNILYLKGYFKDTIDLIAKNQERDPIFVSILPQNNEKIVVPNIKYIFNLFVSSKYDYKYLIVNKFGYLKNLKESKNIISQICEKDNKWHFLPTNSEKFDFDNDGPITHALIKYGCRFILQDKSFEKIPKDEL